MKKHNEIRSYDYKYDINKLAPSAVFYRENYEQPFMRLNAPNNDLFGQAVDLFHGDMIIIPADEELAFAGFIFND